MVDILPTIRPATPSDAPALARLIRAIWREHYEPILGADQVGYMLAKRADPAAITGEIVSGIGWLAAVDDAGEPQAYASHAHADGPLARPDDWKLRQLYVAAAYRRAGLGRALFERVRGAALAAEAISLILTVNRRNHLAQEAYRRWGFHVRGDACTPIGGGFVMDDHVLELPLVR